MSLDKLPDHIIFYIISLLKPKCKLKINYKGLMLANKFYYSLIKPIEYNCNIVKLNDDLKFVINYNKNYYCTCHSGLSKNTLNKLSKLIKENNESDTDSCGEYESKSNYKRHFIHFDTVEKAEVFLNLKHTFRFKIRLKSRCCDGKGVGFYFI